MKKTKLISYLLVFALLFSALSSGAYAFDDSEDTEQTIDNTSSSESASDDSDHLGEAGGGDTRAVVHYYIVEYEDGDMLTGAYSPGTPSMTRYSSGNANSHFYQKWEVSGNISTSCQLFALAGDRPYTLSVSNSNHSLAIRDMDEAGYGDDWKFVSCDISGVYRIQSVNSGTSGQNLYIDDSGLTLSSSNYTMFFVLDYTTYVASTSIEMVSDTNLYIAPESTRSIIANNQNGSTVNPNTITLRASNTHLKVVGNTVTGNSPGECSLTVKDKLTGVYSQYTMTVTEIPEGTYFLKNSSSCNFAEVKNGNMNTGTNIVHDDFDGTAFQRWKIILNTATGYYNIKSAVSSGSYYLTVKDSSSSSGTTVVLGTSSTVDGALWKFQQVSDATGNAATILDRSYKIIPKSGESNGYVLTLATFSSNLIQGSYSASNHKGEWRLHIEKDAALIGIHDSTHEHPHNLFFGSVSGSLRNMGYQSVRTFYDNVIDYDGVDLLAQMCSSDVLVLMAHGSPLQIDMSHPYGLSYEDIVGLPSNSLSNLDMVVLASCKTAQGYPTSSYPGNIVEAFEIQGAHNIIGFRDDVDCRHIVPWMEVFFASLSSGANYRQAFEDADDAVQRDIGEMYGEITTSAYYRVFIEN